MLSLEIFLVILTLGISDTFAPVGVIGGFEMLLLVGEIVLFCP